MWWKRIGLFGLKTRSQRIARQPSTEKDTPSLFPLLFLLFSLGLWRTAAADVSEPIASDVTTRAFSVIWSSDEPMIEGTVRVFSDEHGTNEISADLTISLISKDFPPALTQGIVKVDIVGLEPDSTYYFQTETQNATGTLSYPEASPLPEVHTASRTTLANPANQPIVNDIIQNSIYQPDGTTPASGTLLIVRLPEASGYPLSAFVGKNIDGPLAMVDLNNLFDGNGVSREVAEDSVVEITEYRGGLCEPDSHELVRLRRIPGHEEGPSITEIEEPVHCFSPSDVSADFTCDGRIGAGDLNLFLAHFERKTFDCRYNSDFDLNADNRVGAGDFNMLLSVFGNSE